jgi:hypothetical protein
VLEQDGDDPISVMALVPVGPTAVASPVVGSIRTSRSWSVSLP